MNIPVSYIHHHQLKSKKVYLVLHGGRTGGIYSPFIRRVIDALSWRGESVLACNFTFLEHGETAPKSDIVEEINLVKMVVEKLKSIGYEEIVIVGKSYGAVVASKYLSSAKPDNVSIAILGYIDDKLDTAGLKGRLKVVVQGENDRFGSVDDVRTELAEAGVDGLVVEIAKADHSYRDDQGEPIFEAAAVDALLENI